MVPTVLFFPFEYHTIRKNHENSENKAQNGTNLNASAF